MRWQLSFIFTNIDSFTSWFRIIVPGYWTLWLISCYTASVWFSCSSNSYQPSLKCFDLCINTCIYQSVTYTSFLYCKLCDVLILYQNCVSCTNKNTSLVPSSTVSSISPSLIPACVFNLILFDLCIFWTKISLRLNPVV